MVTYKKNIMVRWSHRCSWKTIAQVFQGFSPYICLMVGNRERIWDSDYGKIYGGEINLWAHNLQAFIELFQWEILPSLVSLEIPTCLLGILISDAILLI